MKLKPVSPFWAIIISVLVFTSPVIFFHLSLPVQIIIVAPFIIGLLGVAICGISSVFIKPKYAELPYDEENYK